MVGWRKLFSVKSSFIHNPLWRTITNGSECISSSSDKDKPLEINFDANSKLEKNGHSAFDLFHRA